MEMQTEYKCIGCKQYSIDNFRLKNHHESCKPYQIHIISEKIKNEYEEKIKQNNIEYKQREIQYLHENEKKCEMLELKLHIRDEEIKILKENNNYLQEKLYSSIINYIKNNIELEQPIKDNKVILSKNASSYQKEPSKNNFSIESFEIKEYKFGDNFSLPIRSDGMINATALCKANGKCFNEYQKSMQTQLFIEKLSLVSGIHLSKLVEENIDGNYGTWVHRQIGYHLAQWILPNFANKIFTIIDNLFILGNVQLDQDHPVEELDTHYKKKIKDIFDQEKPNIEMDIYYKKQIQTLLLDIESNKKQYQSLLIKHNSSMKNHRYIKFKNTDPCFYIIESGVKCECGERSVQYKFGIAGTEKDNTIDDRLKSHRTLWPILKVRFLLFIKDVVLFEKMFKTMYDKEINPNGHEIIQGVLLEEMIEQIHKLIAFFSIKEYHIMAIEKIKEYNEYVDTITKHTIND